MSYQADTRLPADIVVIDDTPENLQLLAEILKHTGYTVRTFPDGMFALKSIQSVPPDLILLDIKMPDMDGYAVCEQLKADEQTRAIPVIFISALNDVGDKIKGFKVGGVDYVSKPFQVEEVLARIKTHLALRELQKELEKKNRQLQQEIARRTEAEEELLAFNEQLDETNQQLETSNRQLQAANACKDRFFSIIAHDLRSPFNGLIGLTGALIEDLEGYTKERLRQLLTKIHTSAEHTYTLLTNLLAWSRLKQGHMTCEPQTIFLAELVAQNIRILEPNTERKHLTIRNLVDKSATVYADPKMVHTVIRNLLSNALKFTASGGSIEISSQQFTHIIEVVVSDTGTGMHQETIDALFRIDVKSSRPGTDGEEGTGLGLILCKELVEKNGGTIRVESEVGRGSRFIVSLLTGQ